jgi:hypothetical protein
MTVVYAYIPNPTRERLLEFVEELERSGVAISHLGKTDPPRKWAGTPKSAIDRISAGTDRTNCTFLEAATNALSMTIELRNDGKWPNSTVSFSCAHREQIDSVNQIVLRTLAPYLCIRGAQGLGKNQVWDVLYQSEDCPELLRRLIRAEGGLPQTRHATNG